MNKRGNLYIFIFVLLVAFTCTSTILLLYINNKPVIDLSNDVENIFALRQERDYFSLILKLGLDDRMVQDYDNAMKYIAQDSLASSQGAPISDRDTFEKVNNYFISQMKSDLTTQTKDFGKFNIVIDSAGDSFTFTKPDFNVSSGVFISISEQDGIFAFNKKEVAQRTTLVWNYSAPLTYSISFSQLGLDSYSRIYYVLNSICDFSVLDSYRVCLAKELPNWKFDENSISVEKITDLQTKQEKEFYVVKFVSKRNYSQFEPSQPISFTLYVEKKNVKEVFPNPRVETLTSLLNKGEAVFFKDEVYEGNNYKLYKILQAKDFYVLFWYIEKNGVVEDTPSYSSNDLESYKVSLK